MKLFALLALVLAMAGPNAGSAQTRLDEHDVQFLEQAAQLGTLDIQASQLALQSAAEESVKQYAQRILIEHERIAGDLQGLASTHQVKLPTELEGGALDTLTSLQQEQGVEFDQRYIDEVAIGAHEYAIKLFKEASEKTQNQDINAFAVKSLSILQQHLNRARNIAKNCRVRTPDIGQTLL